MRSARSILALALALCSCSGRSVPGVAADSAGWRSDLDGSVDAHRSPGELPACDRPCPSSQTSHEICVSGRAFEATSLLSLGPDKATPLGPSDGALVNVYDPSHVLVGFDTSPNMQVDIYNEGGCFVVNVPPFSDGVMISVEDSGGNNDWALFPMLLQTSPGKHILVDLPGLPTGTAVAWGHDLLKDGALLLWYRDTAGMSISGVAPTVAGKPPTGTVLFFADNITTPPYLDLSASSTSKSGLVVLKNAPLATYSGTKPGCTIESAFVGSAPGSISLSILVGDC